MFTIVDNDEAFHPDQSVWMQSDITALAAGIAGDGVISGCAVTAQGSPDMTVAVAAGTVLIAGVSVPVAAGNVTITTANGTNPRIDMIVVSNAGAKSATAGTAASSPKPVDIPASSVLLAMVYVPANDTTIASNQITDKRLMIGTPTNAKHIPSMAANADVIGAGGAGTSEEYDTTTTGLTWSPTTPNVVDSHTTILSHLYVKTTASGETFGTKSWAPGSGAFDARAKLRVGHDKASGYGSWGLHIGDSGNSNRLLILMYAQQTDGRVQIECYTYAAAAYTKRGNTWYYLPNAAYVRLTRDGSNNVTFYLSTDGVQWLMIATLSFTFTVANIGYRVDNDTTAVSHFAADWLRTSV